MGVSTDVIAHPLISVGISTDVKNSKHYFLLFAKNCSFSIPTHSDPFSTIPTHFPQWFPPPTVTSSSLRRSSQYPFSTTSRPIFHSDELSSTSRPIFHSDPFSSAYCHDVATSQLVKRFQFSSPRRFQSQTPLHHSDFVIIGKSRFPFISVLICLNCVSVLGNKLDMLFGSDIFERE